MFGLQASGAAASWVVGRMGTDAHLYDGPDDAAIPDLLDSRFDADKVDALKRLLALIAQGVDVSHLFPQVPLIPSCAAHQSARSLAGFSILSLSLSLPDPY
jgi:hypothetical protein